MVEDAYLPRVEAQDNKAEFTVTGGGSTVYAVRADGFSSYKKPKIQEKINGVWRDYDFQHYGYDGYVTYSDVDGNGNMTYSFAFSFEMTDGNARTFRISQ